jgi:DNA-binding NarL/FixJ family response regulator
MNAESAHDRADPGELSVSVLLVDDHRLFAEVLAMRLRDSHGVRKVETAYSLGTARAVVNVLRPEVVLLDRHLRDDDGLDLMPDLARMQPSPRVLVVSAATDAATVIEALENGADGCVRKDDDLGELLRAVRTVLGGDLYLPAALCRPVVQQLLRETRGDPEAASFVDALSVRETEVLRCLVSGMTRAEIAEHLFISANTVRTHVQNLLKRSGVHSTGALVAAAREQRVPGIGDPWRRGAHAGSSSS